MQLQGVRVVHLPEHVIGQSDAVHLPEGVVVAVIVEVLVVGLEHPPVIGILVGLEAVLPEQQAILVLHEERVSRPRLAADVVEDRADFGVDVGQAVHHRREAAQVLGVPAQVRQDERRLRVLGEQSIALPHQLFERRKARSIEVAAIRIKRHLQPALVLVVHRLEELRRVGGVDEDRDVQPGRGLPDRIELGIVQLQARAVGLARRSGRSPS